MFFEELVQQHRVHRFVAHAVNLAFCIASHQIGVHLFHFLGNKAKPRGTLGINLVLVAEGDWFKAEERLACLVHRLNLLLEATRGGKRADLVV